jgi:hypothetical protein
MRRQQQGMTGPIPAVMGEALTNNATVARSRAAQE